MIDKDPLSRELSFEREDGDFNFLIQPKSGFNDSTTFDMLNRYFDQDFIKANSKEVSYKGGRGQTMLFTLGYQQIGLLYGPKKDLELDVAISSEQEQDKSAASLKEEDGAHDADKQGEKSKVKESLDRDYLLCMRHYCRGGMIGKFNKDGFLRFGKWACRARLEFELTAKLFALGLPVPRPLIAREQVGDLLVKSDIVVEQIPDTKNVAEILEQGSLSDEQLVSIGSTLKSFFKANVFHSDLNIRNILLNSVNQCFVIDFDKCEQKDPLSDKDISAMIERLTRSFNKEKGLKNYEKLDVEAMMSVINAQL